MRTFDNAGFTGADNREVPFRVADDGDIAMLIKYVGSQNAADIEVDAGGDILFKHGAVAATVADTNVATDGKIDTNTEYATLGALQDYINTTTNWRAIMIDGIRADSVDARLLDQGPLDAKTPGGFKLLWDTSTAFDLTQLIAPYELRNDIRPYLDGRGYPFLAIPFRGTRGAVNYMSAVSAYGSGTSVFELITESTTGVGAVADSSTVAFSIAAGANGTEAVAIDGTTHEFVGKFGERFLARLNNSHAMASAALRGFGRLFRSLS